MSLTGTDVKEILEAVLPEEALREAMEAAKFQQREHKLDALVLLRTTILTAASGSGGRQADIMKAYFASEVTVMPSAALAPQPRKRGTHPAQQDHDGLAIAA